VRFYINGLSGFEPFTIKAKYLVMNDVSQQAVVNTYRRYAPFYDRLFGLVLAPGRQALAKAVALDAPKLLLEVGVGTGLTLSAYPATTQIVGVDISPEMLAIARERAAALSERHIELLCLDGETMPFSDATFDAVSLPYVLSVTPDPARLVKELRRVCKPNGKIFIVNHFSGSSFWALLERCVQGIAAKIGFRSSFNYADHILIHDWQVLSVEKVNLFALSKLIILRNQAASVRT
jgi:phosphatidylethanolamine/phosphatidyl-N-methylethanolamine N-methyltransferase